MKKIIEAVKAFFQLKKIIKKESIMKVETIQKIWAIIGTLLATLNPTFLPVWVTDLFGPEGTQLVWSVFNAIVALWQFLPFRTGENKPAGLRREPKNLVYYGFNPFAKG